MQNLLEELKQTLITEDSLVSEGKLLKNKIIELSLALDPKLVKLLLSNEVIKAYFFKDIEGVLVFDKLKFQKFVSNKAFLPDSYTAYKNKIGLTHDDDFITDSQEVVLSWAYKDCVLEGGQSKDEVGREEIFWNETLAPDQIDRLLAPKVLTNWRHITSDGEKKSIPFNDDANLLIKGNNLLALHSLVNRYREKVKLICIDPPYNTNNDSFRYNDSFSHSTWLTFMKNRLEVAKDLLAPDGTIWIVIDEIEAHYLKVLCDQIFTRDCFVCALSWRSADSSNQDAKRFSVDHNEILIYSKKPGWETKRLERTEDANAHYSNPDNDPRGPWFAGNVSSPNPRKNLQFNIITPSGKAIAPPKNGWRWSEQRVQEMIDRKEIIFLDDETRILRKTYLADQKGLAPSSIWDNYEETGHNRQAKYELRKLFPEQATSELFKTPKPERLIKKILDIATDPDDLVLDFFLGSATTAAVAMKMGRKFIGVEQMDYIEDVAVERLKKVIGAEKGGISSMVNWEGGGEFYYCELQVSNEVFVQRTHKATTKAELQKIWEEMQNSAFLSYKIEPRKINDSVYEFMELSIEDQKRFLIEALDLNMLYVPLSEIDDETYNITEEDKNLNKVFYKVK